MSLVARAAPRAALPYDPTKLGGEVALAEVEAGSAFEVSGAENLLASPRFGSARAAYVRAVLDLYEHDPFLNRLLMELGRFLVFATIACLHAAHDDADPDTWSTMSLLKRTMAIYGDVSSPRRIEALVTRFVETGYLDRQPAPSDKRARLLIPSEKMVAHDLEWLAAHYAPLDVMFPGEYVAPLARDRDYLRRHRTIGKSMTPYAAGMLQANRPVGLFMQRDAGIMILMKLLDLTANDPGANARSLSFANIGELFGVSRTHVRDTLRAAERAGLIGIASDAVTLQPILVAAFDRFLADGMVGHAAIHRMAAQGQESRLA